MSGLCGIELRKGYRGDHTIRLTVHDPGTKYVGKPKIDPLVLSFCSTTDDPEFEGFYHRLCSSWFGLSTVKY